MSQRYSESLLLHHARTFDTLPRTANPEFTAAREAMMKTTGNRGSMVRQFTLEELLIIITNNPQENLPDHLTDHLTIPLRTAATVPTTPTQEMHFPSIDSQLSPNTASPRKDDDYPAPLKVPPTPPKIPSTPLDIPSTPPKHQRLPEKDDPFSHSVDMCLAQARIIEDQDDGLKQAILR